MPFLEHHKSGNQGRGGKGKQQANKTRTKPNAIYKSQDDDMHEMQHGGMNKNARKIQRGYGLLLGCYIYDIRRLHALVFHFFDFFLNFYAHLRFDQDLNKFKT